MSAASAPSANSLRAFGEAYLCRRYAVLFYTLIVTLVAAPVLTALDLRGAFIELHLAANLLAAVMPVATGRTRRILLIATAAAGLARLLTAWFDHPALSAMTLGLWTLIAIFAIAGALRFIMTGTSVDAEHIYASLSAYMLAGLFFGLFYWAIEQIGPGTFNTAAPLTRMSALYFSFVTLATLGYGDIVPRTDIARGVAIVEAVGGQLFLAVMVARLVSLYGRGQSAK